jgi:hypothetical protein
VVIDSAVLQNKLQERDLRVGYCQIANPFFLIGNVVVNVENL